ncbi:MAG: efflux RND transporter periplasmic adaptor subunit [Candidatus Rokubacteria bacterium]|nr:efflux RND transporter periplasmic adaptor subunit [Candidatus Rokubacteria bacterium]
MKKTWIAVAALVALGGAALGLGLVRPSGPSPPRGLEVSGRVEGDQAAVGAKVGGKIVRLAVREADRVRAGEPIAQLASEQAQAQLEQARHGLHTLHERLAEARARVVAAEREAEAAGIATQLAAREAEARVGEAEAAVGAARARLAQAEADLERAAKDHERYQALFARELIAAQQLDQAKAAATVARAAVEAARNEVAQAAERLALARASRVTVALREKEAQAAAERLREARAAVATVGAQIQSAEAGVAVARANVEDTRVLAPFTGTVLQRLVEPGEVVAAGTPLVTLVDLSKLHAKVYVAEHDLGKVKVGDPARVYADAFPARYFGARVAEVSQQAEFTPRDVHMKDERVKLVFAVRLAIDNPEGVLKPGMPVDARIRWTPEARWGDGLE